MRLPWSSRVEQIEIPVEDPPAPVGPRFMTHSSPGLEEAVRGVPDDGSCKVLDLGAAVADNVEFVSTFASYIQIVDAVERSPSGRGADGGGFGRLSTLQALFDEHRRSFHMVFLWDLLNYLTPDQTERAIRAVGELCLPTARLHAIVFATETMAEVPSRYRILSNNRIAYEPVTSEVRGVSSLPPAAVERLLKGFRIEHSFVLQHGVHEYVATRKRWYVKK